MWLWLRKGKVLLPALKRVFYGLGLFIGGGLFVYQLVLGIQSLKSIHLGWNSLWQLLLALLMMLGVVGLQMLNWRFILAGFGVQIGFQQVFEGYVVSFLPRYIPGSVWGYLSRSQWLYQKYGVSYSISNLSSLIEVGVTFLTGSVLAGLAVWDAPQWPLLYACVLIVAVWLLVRKMAGMLFLKSSRWREASGFLMHLSWKHWLLWLLNCLLQWFLLGWVTLFCVAAVGGNLFVDWVLAAAIFSIAWTMGLVIVFVPAGLGIREMAFMNFLQLFFAIPTQFAAWTAILVRLFYSLAELFWMLSALVTSRITKRTL